MRSEHAYLVTEDGVLLFVCMHNSIAELLAKGETRTVPSMIAQTHSNLLHRNLEYQALCAGEVAREWVKMTGYWLVVHFSQCDSRHCNEKFTSSHRYHDHIGKIFSH